MEQKILEAEGLKIDGMRPDDADKLHSFTPADAASLSNRYNAFRDDDKKRESRRFYLGFGPSPAVIAHEMYCELESYREIQKDFTNFMVS